MKTTVKDLNEYLFETMDRLSNDTLDEEQLDMEIKRAEAMTKVAGAVIENAHLQFKAYELAKEYGANVQMPALLGMNPEE